MGYVNHPAACKAVSKELEPVLVGAQVLPQAVNRWKAPSAPSSWFGGSECQVHCWFHLKDVHAHRKGFAQHKGWLYVICVAGWALDLRLGERIASWYIWGLWAFEEESIWPYTSFTWSKEHLINDSCLPHNVIFGMLASPRSLSVNGAGWQSLPTGRKVQMSSGLIVGGLYESSRHGIILELNQTSPTSFMSISSIS